MLRLAIITGLSGSGKSTAKKCFEDMGYFTIDNLPVPLVSEFLRLLVHSHEGVSNIAMVMDARIADFLGLLPQTIEELRGRGYTVDLIYLDCDDETLNRRFSETRRKHPLSPNDSPSAGIKREREILKAIKAKSDLVIDTTKLNVHQLKDVLNKRFQGKNDQRRMAIRVTTFGYRYGVPRDADLVFDVRFLPNPFFKDELRDLTGLDKQVADYVLQSEIGKQFMAKLSDMLDFLVPLYLEEGKAYLNIAIGCTGGRHRSVAIAHSLAKHLKSNYSVKVEDRDVTLPQA